MSEVKTYDIEDIGSGYQQYGSMFEQTEYEGDWVTIEDYKALERQLAEAREEKQQLKSIANNLLYWDTCPNHYKETIAKMYGWDEELRELQLKEQGE